MRITSPLLLLLLTSPTVLAQGLADLGYNPAALTAQVGDIINVSLVATSQSSTLAEIGALDALVTYDPAVLTLLGDDQSSAGYAWFAAGFFPDPDGINASLADGQALFTALAQITVPAIAPQGAGLLVTDLRFSVLALSPGTQISLAATGGTFGETKVLDFHNANLVITGDISGVSTVTVTDPSASHSYCAGDGSGTPCPCGANAPAGLGCLNSAGIGAQLVASGSSSISNDSFQIQISGIPGAKPGLILKGANQVNGGAGLPAGDGLFCVSGSTNRSHVQVTNGAGTTLFTDFSGQPFGAFSNGAGVPTTYQFWYRDPAGTCSGSQFNFSNAWTTTWLP